MRPNPTDSDDHRTTGADLPTIDPLAESQTLTVPPTALPYSMTGLQPAEKFGRYRVVKKLGEGGMGAVYLAEDTLLSRQVAIKIPFITGPLAESIKARFLREARAVAAIQHPNICPIHDMGEIDGTPYLTLAYISGAPLHVRIQRGPLPPAEAVPLIVKLADALQIAHDRGVIHRDLKPANIMIDDRQEPIIMDFGLARRADGEAASQLTQQGQMIGTPAYMPPEQLSGDVAAMGPGSDIYSLGMVLYEMLAGKLPFQGDILSLVSQIACAQPRPPSSLQANIDARLDAICLKALAKAPSERWESMKEMATALERYRATVLAYVPTLAGVPTPFRVPALPSSFLSLRVEGTPYLYRPRPDQTVITVGRQRRGHNDPPDHGNDFVLRVAGNDLLSARISRRHFEIHRHGDQYTVIDRSKAGIQLNGTPIPKNAPVPIRVGDRLVIAGVITLEVLLQQEIGGVISAGVQMAQASRSSPQVELEASMGDMVTID